MSARSSRSWLPALALALLSLALTLLAAEVALRVRKGAGLSHPDPAHAVRLIGETYPATYDLTLGYAPTPGAHVTLAGAPVAIDARGLRENGNDAPPPDQPSILAVGDSFTFGDEVDDRSTWPSVLERRLGQRVWNGGVFGYGLDQMTLRAEQLAPVLAPSVLVVSMIPDDVSRCEDSYRFAHKPWFELEGSGLALRNVPVPRPEAPPPGDTALRRLLSRSFLADLVLRRIDPIGWPLRGSVRVQRDGGAVAAALVDRLADVASQRGMRLLLVAGWHPAARSELLDPVRERARARRIELLELEPVLTREIETHSGDWSGLFQVAVRYGGQAGYMTPSGNEMVADAIAERLRVPATAGNP
ncbi:MAG TPA: SGNH/GDSL hydrolase family protein [Myxococcota bacterium]|nr:SGNH/GDSL hydrolase family protein [Myxococcota bacterium]